MKVLFDTSALVAAIIQAHPAHRRALPWLHDAHARRHDFFVAGHSFAELYAVLTTLPLQPRLSPEIAARLINENVGQHATVVTLSPREYARLPSACAEQRIAGGVTYDAVIVAAARKAKVDRLLTLNLADFRRLWPGGADQVMAP